MFHGVAFHSTECMISYSLIKAIDQNLSSLIIEKNKYGAKIIMKLINFKKARIHYYSQFLDAHFFKFLELLFTCKYVEELKVSTKEYIYVKRC